MAKWPTLLYMWSWGSIWKTTSIVLGHWVADGEEGANFWLSVITDLQNRGVQDIFIANMGGLIGFSEALHAVFPQTEVQRCIIHQIRNSPRYVSWKDHKAFVKDLKQIYQAGRTG
jgi:putative transposase